MDKVRLGRALGYGARHAAKSLLAAADAAAAPEPPTVQKARRDQRTQPGIRDSGRAAPPEVRKAVQSAAQGAVQSAARVRTTGSKVARHAGRSFFSPLARFSSVVSLQVTGTFFALLALIMGQAMWRARGAVYLGVGSAQARRFYVLSAVCLLFSYFAASNFVRAHRRERR